MSVNFEEYIASIPDFPSEGVLFRDVTPMFENPEVFRAAIKEFANFGKSVKADLILGPESRGFVFGAPTALEMNVGFAPVRKPGKLPRETISQSYELEYGTGELHLHTDAVKKGQRVLIIDDLLATGGTALATCKLVERLGGVVAGLAFVIELEGLPGREVLKDYDVFTLLKMTDK